MTDDIRNVEQRAYKTYVARVVAHRRLVARGHAWNTLLISFSTAGVLASIAALVKPEIYGLQGPTVAVLASVLTLLGSVTVASMNYGTRAGEMFRNYRQLQRLSVEAERLVVGKTTATVEQLETLSERYQDLLDQSENHTPGDWALARRQIAKSQKTAEKTGEEETAEIPKDGPAIEWSILRDKATTNVPYLALIIPVWILIPTIGWLLE